MRAAIAARTVAGSSSAAGSSRTERRDQLLDEQRVPAGGRDDAFDGVGVRRGEQRADDLGGLAAA